MIPTIVATFIHVRHISHVYHVVWAVKNCNELHSYKKMPTVAIVIYSIGVKNNYKSLSPSTIFLSKLCSRTIWIYVCIGVLGWQQALESKNTKIQGPSACSDWDPMRCPPRLEPSPVPDRSRANCSINRAYSSLVKYPDTFGEAQPRFSQWLEKFGLPGSDRTSSLQWLVGHVLGYFDQNNLPTVKKQLVLGCSANIGVFQSFGIMSCLYNREPHF